MLSSNKPQEKIKAQVQINPKQHHALTTVVRLLHRPKLQVFCSESNMVVRDVRYLSKSEAAVHRKRLIQDYLFTKLAGLQPVPVSLPNISELFFGKTRLGVGCFC